MKLGFFERFYVNGGVRAFWHQPRIVRWFLRQAPLPAGGDVLEVGCGAGNGVKLIHKYFQPAHVTGTDYDPRQVEVAKARVGESKTVTFKQADAGALRFQDQQFHAVFSFGAIHHVPDWEAAIGELYRVLKPGGYVFLEEYYRGFLQFPLTRLLAPHPPGRFAHGELLAALQHVGFEIIASQHSVPGVCGVVVARKT